MHAVAPVTGRQFAWFRIVLGLYLAIHFAHLVPWGPELFSRAGVLPDAALNPTNGILPNVLVWWDTPEFVTSFLVVMTVLAVLFAGGVARHVVAPVLWYGWACLFNRNVLISNPSIPYVGSLLLFSMLVPVSEPYRVGGKTPREDFYVPGLAYWGVWLLLGVGYMFSGVAKMASPSWVDGTAFWHILQNPLARDGWIRDLMLGMPSRVLIALTWTALALELLFLPLALWRWTRPLVWLALVAMHVGIIGLVSFADLSAGMLMVHLFTWDARWPAMARAVRR